ncbi:AAA family ATPase [Heyndrickxia ginsengihumi]|uniref:AAA family ATPase n=1 Tax=Heyndrickxia ginsengihumi TaxID=363870 RepID=UPI00046F016A|nr:SMC family ATPase [Heyndrickxia ginsengihumi]
MRPLVLTMQAFGPYAQKEVIDFTKLGNQTMFVISGKTGAGKTTIFDGICFAIYGRASGEDRIGNELRSQFANDETETEVSLTFSLRNQQYYIWRAPQQEKKKTRGEGYKTIGARAELYQLNEHGDKQIIAANVRETDEKIKELLQLDVNQFRQILMIPQGEFRKLLVSDSKEKEVILQRLFHTELYKRIEEKLKDEATLLKKTVESKLEERSKVLREISFRENEELKILLQEEHPNDVLILPLLDQEIKRHIQLLEQLQLQYNQKKYDRDHAKKKYDDAEALIKQLEEKNQLMHEKEALEVKKQEIQLKQVEIEFAYKAQKLEHQEKICHRLKKEKDDRANELKAAEMRLLKAKQTLQEAEHQYKQQVDKEPLRLSIQEQLTTLNNMREQVETLAKREMDVEHYKHQYNQYKKQTATLEQNLRDVTKKLTSLREQQLEANNTKIQIVETERELEIVTDTVQRIEKVINEWKRINNANQLFLEKDRQLHDIKLQLKDANSTYDYLQDKWRLAQASILAEQLTEGVPCPVCGSTHHPRAAEKHGEIPSELDLKSAKEKLTMLENRRAEIEASCSQLQAEIKIMTERVDDLMMTIKKKNPEVELKDIDLFQKQLQKEKITIVSRLQSQQQKVEALEKINSELKNLEDKQNCLSEALEKSIQQERTMEHQYFDKKSAYEYALQSLPEAIRTKAQFEKQIHDLNVKKQELEQQFEFARTQVQRQKEHVSACIAAYGQLQDLVKKIEEQLKVERQQFIHLLEEQGFNSFQHYHDSKRDQQTISLLEKSVQVYREEYRSVCDRLQYMVNKLKDVEMPDVQMLKKQFMELEQSLTDLLNEQTSIKIQIQKHSDIKQKVETINEQMKKSEQQYKFIGHLADIAKGQNTYRITFERFVLAAFLDDILQVANYRLYKMTSGRYKLRRKKERSKGNVQSGLELLIFDEYTGQERHVKTLSGGESFKAALSLALGLADVVQQYAGGVSLETMFIDEGFGTLDPESLDQAIESLIEIQSSGRLVGIISHVPELKERINARLEVISTQTGSHTAFQFLQ